jgi:hypothetical protein
MQHWRVYRKGGWRIKGRWHINEREIFKGRESSTGSLCEREGNVEGKEDIKGRKYLRKEDGEGRKVLREGRF